MIKSLNSTYRILDRYALRTPLFPLKTILDIYDSDCNIDAIWEQFQDPCIKEAIFLASPDFYEQLENVQAKGLDGTKEKNKLTIPLLKYLTRISTRCTPFGLFAGTSVGTFAETTNIVLEKQSQHLRHTRLDFEVLAQLTRSFISNPNVLPTLTFYPNTTLYKSVDQFRYIKVVSVEGVKQYNLKRIAPNEFIASTIDFASSGKTFEQLVEYIVSLDFEDPDAEDFIKTLINAQVIVSDLEPYTVGEDFLGYLLDKLEDDSDLIFLSLLENSRLDMKTLDETIGSNLKIYQKNLNSFDEMLPSLKKQHLFQVDLYPKFKHNTLSSKLKINISKSLNVLSSLFESEQSEKMIAFVQAYQARYESQSVPLVQVLDLDYGIGYPINENKATYPYINELTIGFNEKKTIESVNLNKTEVFLAGLLNKSNGRPIDIALEDLSQFELKDPNLNATFFSLAEFFSTKGETQLYLNSFDGSSVSNLLGRFTGGSSETKNLVEEIIHFEEQYHKEYIVAEIAHLPEDRTGNVLFHPEMRKYKINFLSGVNKDNLKDISIDDLLISIIDSKVVLKSRKLNKPIVPYLSNAHNFTNSSLPLYRFLCDLQFHNYGARVGFDWGQLSKLFEHLPRITYKNIVLSKEQWSFQTNYLNSIFKKNAEDSVLIAASKKLKADKNLPRYVQLKQRDNLLLIDMNSAISIKMLITALPRLDKARVTFIEFLQHDSQIVQDENEFPFTNEFVFCLANRKKSDGL